MVKKKKAEKKEVSRKEINGNIVITFDDGSFQLIPAPIDLTKEEAEELFGEAEEDEEEEEEEEEETEEEDDDEEEEEDDEEEEEDSDEEDEDDSEEDEEEEEELPVRHRNRKQVKEKPQPTYSQEHMTKIISAKHNKMKNQFLKKTQEYQDSVNAELEKSKAVVDWLCRSANLDEASLLAKIGYTPTNSKKTIDSKMYDDVGTSGQDDESFQAEAMEMRSKAKKYPGYIKNEKMILEYAKDTGLTIDKAYWALMGADAVKAAKNGVIYKKQSKARKVTEGSGGRMPKAKPIDKSIERAARQVGMTPEDYLKYQSIDNIDDYFAKTKKTTSKKRR